MSLVAGADVGGSKTVAAVADGVNERARASGPGAPVRPGRAMTAASTIARVIRTALNQAGYLRASALVVGAAGVGREEDRRALRDALRVEDLADRLVVTTDLEIALEAALGTGPGIVLLAGTGSIAAARLNDSTVARQGGYGWQMGDEGSGYALGRAALLTIGRAQDGRAPATELTGALLAATRSADFGQLVQWAVSAEPAEVAALGATVLEVAERGDRLAGAIVEDAARELAAHVQALVPKFSGNKAVKVVLGGGLLDRAAYRRAVREELAHLHRVRAADDSLDPVTGALSMARRLGMARVT
jgi:glucosamine kinase